MGRGRPGRGHLDDTGPQDEDPPAHRVPLSSRALAILRDVRPLARGGLVFPAPRGGVLRGAVWRKMLIRLEVGGTVHGMRTALRTWAAETGVDRAVAEAGPGARRSRRRRRLPALRPAGAAPRSHGGVGRLPGAAGRPVSGAAAKMGGAGGLSPNPLPARGLAVLMAGSQPKRPPRCDTPHVRMRRRVGV